MYVEALMSDPVPAVMVKTALVNDLKEVRVDLRFACNS